MEKKHRVNGQGTAIKKPSCFAQKPGFVMHTRFLKDSMQPKGDRI